MSNVKKGHIKMSGRESYNKCVEDTQSHLSDTPIHLPQIPTSGNWVLSNGTSGAEWKRDPL